MRREFLESMLDRVATGRTVLLSSHQISEVERVADEVAILHDGKFCIQESLSVLRETVHEITVNLEDPLTEIPQFEPPAQVLREQCEGRHSQVDRPRF